MTIHQIDHGGTDTRALRRCERGQGLTELVLTMPMLMLLALGMIEVNRAIETHHILSTLTREAANLASRGSTLTEAVNATRANQAATGLGSDGGVVASHILITSGIPKVVSQVSSSGYNGQTMVGLPDSIARPYMTAELTEGRDYYVVEIFLPYRSVTGFDRLMPRALPSVLYDRTLF
jgi:Flp pilus assembly protein TadG